MSFRKCRILNPIEWVSRPVAMAVALPQKQRQSGTNIIVLASGLLIALSLGAVALGFPSGAYLLAGSGTSPDGLVKACASAEVALDEGYGVTRREFRNCPNSMAER